MLGQQVSVLDARLERGDGGIKQKKGEEEGTRQNLPSSPVQCMNICLRVLEATKIKV